MKFPRSVRLRLPDRLGQTLAIAGILFLSAVLCGWTIWFLRREAARARTPASHGVEIPVLDRSLLSEIAGRVPR